MAQILFKNISIFDGTGVPPFPGEVLVEGNRIKAVAQGSENFSKETAEIVDGAGATLLPGLIAPHAHLTFPSAVDRIYPGVFPPVERLAYFAAHNAKVLLDYGYTSAYSGGATNPSVEVQLRDEIEAGYIPGPRLLASSFERFVGGDPLPYGQGAEDVRQFMQDMNELGVDNMKIILSGRGNLFQEHFEELCYNEADLTEMSKLAQEADLNLSVHAYSAESIQLAIRFGFRALYHCNFADEPTLDLMEANKDKFFVAPAVGIITADYNLGDDAPEGSPHAQPGAREGIVQIYNAQREVIPKMRERGIRVLPGGDYGFPHNPHGKDSWDAELFVTDFGFTPEETLKAMTLHGAELMRRGDELGQVKEGYIADLIMVDGDPTRQIELLQDLEKIPMVMKDGRFHRRQSVADFEPRRAAAE